ncbi:MAG: TetR/AcrR family transcriptional regulator [Pseudomonadota bacterium]
MKKMTKKKPDKQALLTDLAQHVLKHGLNNASLRPMAKAAGTSDRMLIYYFGGKDALIAELLEHLASQMAVGLDRALPIERVETEDALVMKVLALMRSKDFYPYTRVWLEIVAGAAQGMSAHRLAGNRIVLIFLEWLALRHPDGERGAPRTLTLIEGCLVMDAVGHSSVADLTYQTTQSVSR